MNKKVLIIGLLILLLAASNVSAYDAGSLWMSIQPEFGYLFPDAFPDYFGMYGSLGLGFGFNFINLLGVNTGVGINGSWYAGDSVTMYTSYISVPIGLNFNLGALYLGSGITINFPVYLGGYVWAAGGGSYDLTEFALTYLGFYFDLGFDTSGFKGKRAGFGITTRFSCSFSDKALSSYFGYAPKFRHMGLTLVFRPSFRLAKFF